jgi:hypothetical protein
MRACKQIYQGRSQCFRIKSDGPILQDEKYDVIHRIEERQNIIKVGATEAFKHKQLDPSSTKKLLGAVKHLLLMALDIDLDDEVLLTRPQYPVQRFNDDGYDLKAVSL